MIKLPKEIFLEQGSQEWLDYRRTKVMASDVAVIMGCGFKSLLDLYEEKVYGNTVQMNDAMRRGVRLEPIARKWMEDKMSVVLTPKVYQHGFIDFMGCSLDGIDNLGNICIEIKCGDSAYKHAENWEIPIYYKWQMQNQMEIMNLEFIYYIVYLEGKDPIVMKYERNDVMIEKLILACKAFYFDHILPKIPPSTKPARIDVSHEDSARKLRLEMNFRNREELKNKIKHLEGLVECLDQLIIEDACGESIELGKWKCTKVVTKGTVQYKNIEILKNIDLDLYRSEPKESWRIS